MACDMNSVVSQIKCEINEEKGVNSEEEGEEIEQRKEMKRNEEVEKVSKEEESEEQCEMKEVKSEKKLVIVVSSDSEDDVDVYKPNNAKKIVKPEEGYERNSSRERKVVKSMKKEITDSDEKDERPSSKIHSDQMFRCDYCQRLFKYKRGLDRHVKLHTGDRKYRCTQCEFASSRSDHLKVHMKTHDSGKPYQCAVCNRGYNTAAALNSHMQNHKKVTQPITTAEVTIHSDQMFRCDYCQQLFKHKRGRDRHVKLHTGDRKYRCTQCESAFSRSDHLKKHLKTHDKGKPTTTAAVTVSKEEESEEQCEMKEAKSDKKLVIDGPSDSEDDVDIYKPNNAKKIVKPEEGYERHSSRQRKVVKSMKDESPDTDESDERLSSEEDDEYEIPVLDPEVLVRFQGCLPTHLPLKEEEEAIRERREMKGKDKKVSKEEESEEQCEMKEVKSFKKPVIVVSSDSEDDANTHRPNKRKAVKQFEESYLRRSSRQRKVVKSMKEESTDSDESDERPSSKEDDENEDPDFDQKEEVEAIKKTKEKKRKDKKVTECVKKEPMSAYELMIQKNREEKMAFLQSLQMDEVKASFSEIVGCAKQPVKRKLKNVERPSILRKSRRLENVKMDFCEKTLYYNALNKAEEKPKQVIPPKMTFKEALKYFYESYKDDVAIQEESKSDVKFTIYDKSVLGKMTVSEENIARITPGRITALTWYPSPEHLIIAAGDVQGQLGIWNIESENPYVFNIHLSNISNLQFNQYDQTQLISSSYDGTLRCGDMVKHQFSEIYNISDTWCTYFDVLSASTYLVGQKNGEVALVDKRNKNKSCLKKHVCNDHKIMSSIKTVNIHPTDKNFFLTAGNKGCLRLWDLRKLQRMPVADITHHKQCVQSAFFSPVTGNTILAFSYDYTISMFDSKNLTSDIKLRALMKMVRAENMHYSKATWLPNSDETFVIGNMHEPRIEVYDRNMFVYHYMINENLTRIGTNAFHPTRPALAGGNSSGKVFIFV